MAAINIRLREAVRKAHSLSGWPSMSQRPNLHVAVKGYQLSKGE